MSFDDNVVSVHAHVARGHNRVDDHDVNMQSKQDNVMNELLDALVSDNVASNHALMPQISSNKRK